MARWYHTQELNRAVMRLTDRDHRFYSQTQDKDKENRVTRSARTRYDSANKQTLAIRLETPLHLPSLGLDRNDWYAGLNQEQSSPTHELASLCFLNI